MSYVRHMDLSLNRNLRVKVGKDLITLVSKFCQATTHRRAMLRLEDKFRYYLDSYAKAALLEETRHSTEYRAELCGIITRARALSREALEKDSRLSK